MNEKYYSHLDQLKGLAILLMVMGHALAWSYPDYTFLSNKICTLTTEQANASLIWKIIYSFHMPLLFFVSGFLFFKDGDTERYLAKIKKRIYRLLIPYIITGCFVLYIKGYFGYWFLITLFVLNLIVIVELYFLSKIKDSLLTDIISRIVVFVLLSVIAKFTKDYLPKPLTHLANLSSYYVAFMFGYMVHKSKVLDNFIKHPSVSMGCFVLYGCLMVISNYFDIYGIVRLVIPICAIIFLYNFLSKYQINWLGEKIGKNSMEIYIFHLFFIASFREVGQYILQINNLPLSITIQLTYSLLVSAVAIILSLSVARVIKSNRNLAFLFGFKYDEINDKLCQKV